MSFLCRIGIHDWGMWTFIQNLSQERKCWRCGLTQVRKVKIRER